MDQFKLLSIDEFDSDFASSQAKKANETDAFTGFDSLIPDMENEEKTEGSYFKKPAVEEEVEPEFNPFAQEETVKTPRPLVPIGQKSAYSPVGAPEQTISEDDFGDEEEEKKAPKAKSSAGAMVGKVISIVLLAATIVVFVLGCFVTVFLDNNGSDIGGICFNTMSTDVIDSNGEKIVSKGDLIISKKAEPSEFNSGAMIAVPSIIEEGRCDLHIINSINSAYSESTEITTTDITTNGTYSSTIMSDACYGIVTNYIPVLGGLLHFAMDNVILVCILFVLLAALWCLILVLIENKKPKTKAE